jgi:acetylornithine deacetylase/succinyl-diaminopimelate desuccinylase-like protein
VINRLIDRAIQIQQIPAPTFEEAVRAEFIQRMFAAESLADIQTDAAGNVFARLPGAGHNSPLVVSAHLDTVFPAGTNLAVRRESGKVYGPGIGDNSLGVAGLFGLLWSLRERGIEPSGDLWLVANTGEEGLGDLRGMKAVVERFGDKPKAYLVLEGMALGHVYHKAIGVKRYKISTHVTGGHSWIDYGSPSAIHEISALATKIAAIRPPVSPRTTLNIGRIGGGTTINTIAAEAWMELDLRSEGQATLNDLIHQVEKLINTAERSGVKVKAEVIGQRPSGEISAEYPLLKLAQACLREQRIEPVLTAGSTDANIPLSKGYPALVLGLTYGGGAHTVQEYFETAPLGQGLEQLVQFVSRVWK